jgi:hypothetical protein
MTARQRKTSGVAGAAISVAITKGTQVWAIYLASSEIRQPGQADEAVLAFCALVFLGSQAAEDIAVRLIDKFFGTAAATDERDSGIGR